MKTLSEYLKTVTTKLEFITPKKAQQIIDQTDFKNRKKKDFWIKQLSEEINNGKWLLTHQGISISDRGNLIDGQNRLHAIILAGYGVWMNVSRGFPEESFYQIDKGIKRGLADNYHVADIPGSEKQSRGVRCFFKIRDGVTEYPTHDREKELKRTDKDYIDFYFENESLCKSIMIQGNILYYKNKMLSLTETYGFMMYLIKEKKYSKEEVFSFMNQLYLIDIPENQSLTVLFQRLVEDKNSPDKLKNKIKWAFIIKTFNSWVIGEEMKRLRYVPQIERFPKIINNPSIK